MQADILSFWTWGYLHSVAEIRDTNLKFTGFIKQLNFLMFLFSLLENSEQISAFKNVVSHPRDT